MIKTTTDTGIFARITFEGETLEETKELFRSIKQPTVENLLDGAEAEARQVLLETTGKADCKTLPHDAPLIAGDAQQVHAWVVQMRRTITEKEAVRKAAYQGFMLGRAFERMRVRPHEPMAKRAKSNAAKQKAGYRRKYGDPAEKQAIFLAEFKKATRSPGTKIGTAVAAAAKVAGIGTSTGWLYRRNARQK